MMNGRWLGIAISVAVAVAGCGKDEPGGSAAKPGAAKPAPAMNADVKLSLPTAETTAIEPERLAKAQRLLNGGLAFLLARRDADGTWSLGKGAMKPAITALVLKCLLQHPDFDRTSPAVQRGLEVLRSYQQPDGAVFDPKQGRPAYSTAITIMALVSAGDPQFNGAIRRASQYLQGIQIQPGQESPDGEVIGQNDAKVGGVGYGKNKEPNLSVLQFVMEAWHESGMEADHEAMKRAVGFLSRIQNRSESNPMAFAKQGSNDGGFVYDLETSKAGEGPGGAGLRSYGSMTYAGFKSMLYAGVDKNDPRVQAAYMWIRRYWRLDSNPNMPKLRSNQGLFYYFHVFGKTLRAWGQDEIPDLKGTKHNWRNELIDALAARVGPDGSWANKDASRWEEGNPVLGTCYAVLALEEALRK